MLNVRCDGAPEKTLNSLVVVRSTSKELLAILLRTFGGIIYFKIRGVGLGGEREEGGVMEVMEGWVGLHNLWNLISPRAAKVSSTTQISSLFIHYHQSLQRLLPIVVSNASACRHYLFSCFLI